MKHSLATCSDYVNVRWSMTVRVDHKPKPAQSENCRHAQIL